jgi:hypothetical protein
MEIWDSWNGIDRPNSTSLHVFLIAPSCERINSVLRLVELNHLFTVDMRVLREAT